MEVVRIAPWASEDRPRLKVKSRREEGRRRRRRSGDDLYVLRMCGLVTTGHGLISRTLSHFSRSVIHLALCGYIMSSLQELTVFSPLFCPLWISTHMYDWSAFVIVSMDTEDRTNSYVLYRDGCRVDKGY